MRPASAACQSTLLSGGKGEEEHNWQHKAHKEEEKKKQLNNVQGDTHLLRNLEPGLLEAKDRAAVEGGGDLEHGVVVVETAAYVGHSHPFLYDRDPWDHILTAQDLCGNKVAYLAKEKREMQDIDSIWLLKIDKP